MRERNVWELAGMVQATYDFFRGAANRQEAKDFPMCNDFVAAYDALTIEARTHYPIKKLLKFIDQQGNTRGLLEGTRVCNNPLGFQSGLGFIWNVIEAHLLVRRVIDDTYGCGFQAFDRALGVTSAYRWATFKSLILSWNVQKALQEAEKSNPPTIEAFGEIYQKEVSR